MNISADELEHLAWRRRVIDRGLPKRLANRKCKACGHRLEEHWWEESEYCCAVDWTNPETLLLKSGEGDDTGCPCGEFQGITWLDLWDNLSR